jgi:ABC transporter, ATP-binding/permease protein
MLRIENVSKYYKYGKNRKVILDKVNISLGRSGMVAIIGASGSGKSTLLNIIAGSLRSDEGKVIVEDKDIQKLGEKEINYYRNKVVGYIYQDYNLIEYMSVYDNVRIGYSDNNRDYVLALLKQLDIYDKRDILVMKLSGGEKQRVAIARAMINNPRILLCDEPTGALDSQNGIMVMEILKKISENRLVIVVSHDKDLVSRYADEIINISDGVVMQDKKGNINNDKEDKIIYKRVRMRKLRKIALRHLFSNKKRTIMTMSAISLGIISMMMILCMGNNFNKEMNNLEKEVVGVYPIIIRNGEYIEENTDIKKEEGKIYPSNENIYENKITEDYLDYLNSNIGSDKIIYNYFFNKPVISDKYKVLDSSVMKIIPDSKYIEDNYKIIIGNNVRDKYDILLKVDKDGNVNKKIIDALEISLGSEYESIIGRQIKFINNDIYYKKGEGHYYINDDYEEMFNDSEIALTIVGIIQEKEDNNNGSFIYYDKMVQDELMMVNKNSQILIDEVKGDGNVLGIDIDKEEMIRYLGGSSTPNEIEVYSDNISDKDKIINVLKEYNNSHDKIIYEDVMASNIKIVRDFISIISGVLIIFSGISLIVSLIMISILTSIRVLERKKEIGILRSIGASKRNIKMIFNYENGLIGLGASIGGIIILNLLVKPINTLIYNLTKLDNLLVIDYRIVFLVMVINILIVVIAGSSPSRKASKLDITKCIYGR